MQPKWFGVAAAAVGLVLLCFPYRHTVPFEDEAGVIEASATCLPLRDLFKRTPEGGWLGYDPDDRSADLASSFCGPTARRRAAPGLLAMVAGAAVLLWARRRNRPDRQPPPPRGHGLRRLAVGKATEHLMGDPPPCRGRHWW